MGISISLILAAAGAVLIWAVHATSSGFNIHVAGVIMLVVGTNIARAFGVPQRHINQILHGAWHRGSRLTALGKNPGERNR